MKLAKLSLAAIMTVGAMSAVNAGSLEESIKGVDFSGFARYRFYDESNDLKAGDRHRFSGSASLTAPITDSWSFKTTLEVERSDYAANAPASERDSVEFSDFYFQYSANKLTVKAGRQAIGTPLSDGGYRGTRGNGALATYALNDSWTVVGGAFVNTNIKVGIGGGFVARTLYDADTSTGKDAYDPFFPTVDGDGRVSYAVDIGEENLYAMAVMGAAGPVNMQLWAYKVEHVIKNSFFAQVDGKFGPAFAKAQYTQAEYDFDGWDTAKFYGVELGAALSNFKVKGGYTDTGSNGAVHIVTADDSTIKAGKQMYYEFNNIGDTSTYFFTADASFGAFGVGAGYVDSSTSAGSSDKFKGKEYYLQASYKIAKNFGTTLYYSDMNLDEIATVSTGDNKEIRFEAKYSF